MTKKDYIALAKLIKDNGTMANLRRGITHVITTGTFMNSLCEYLKNDNSNFNEVKFREATGEILNKNDYKMREYIVTLKVDNEKIITWAINEESAINNILNFYRKNYNRDWGITAKFIKEL